MYKRQQPKWQIWKNLVDIFPKTHRSAVTLHHSTIPIGEKIAFKNRPRVCGVLSQCLILSVNPGTRFTVFPLFQESSNLFARGLNEVRRRSEMAEHGAARDLLHLLDVLTKKKKKTPQTQRSELTKGPVELHPYTLGQSSWNYVRSVDRLSQQRKVEEHAFLSNTSTRQKR